ncbi:MULTISPECIES: hypothetical protein [unclassified Sphingobium]|uniref:hypothetical protein n=1 Tax=unclassified Sphingobium TaxID=2611147 RepID=UPI0007703A95|nr:MULTISPECIES: hypothetical protein [unclassified Sphingobium]AMK16832.1 hypothetical protein K663_02215 [Sphingobium sp. MI1205]
MSNAQPKSDAYNPEGPCVGIFWRVPTSNGPKLVSHVVSLKDADEYGDFLTHPTGHYEVWEAWRAAGSAALKRIGLPIEIVSSEYEEHPRGRVVFDRRAEQFIVYADRRLQKAAIISDIAELFAIGGHPHIVRSDSHYVARPMSDR